MLWQATELAWQGAMGNKSIADDLCGCWTRVLGLHGRERCGAGSTGAGF